MNQLLHRLTQTFGALLSIFALISLLTACGGMSSDGISSGDSQRGGTGIAQASNVALTTSTPSQLTPIAVPTAKDELQQCAGIVNSQIKNENGNDVIHLTGKGSCGPNEVIVDGGVSGPCQKDYTLTYLIKSTDVHKDGTHVKVVSCVK